MTENTRPCKERGENLALLASGDLPDGEMAETMDHLSKCPACRARWAALQEDHRALQGYTRSLQDHVVSLERNVISSVLEERREAKGPIRLWRWIMATTPRRVLAAGAAAAALIVAVLLTHMATAPFTAWADVLENARGAESCRLRVRNLDSQAVETVKVFSDLGYSNSTYENGELVEKMCFDFSTKTAVHMIPPLERGVTLELGDAILEKYREKNPKNLFVHLAGMEHEDLGRREMDGRKVVGIRVSGRNLVPELVDEAEFEVWADPDTKWPVRIDVKGTSAGGRVSKRIRFYDFQWNYFVQESDFRPEIPGGFDMVSGVEMEMDEEHSIDALREYARVVKRYPGTLAYQQLTPEMWRLMGRRVLSTEVLPIVHRIRGACEFYGKLVQEGKDVLYFGDRVAPGESARVLMRWKTGEDRYRVIFGDLRVETVSGVKLIDIEAN
jgi:hypothetical protein